MRVKILASAPGADEDKQYLTTYVIDDRIAIDAGCLGLFGQPEDQARITDVFLTHSHVDHVGSLPVFVENTFDDSGACVVVHGNDAALASLRTDVFNDRLWPNFLDRKEGDASFLELHPLEPEESVDVGGLTVTPVLVDHVVPTFGYLVEDAGATVVFGADSGPTTRIWELARRRPNLRAAFVESSFPNRLEWLAEVSAHLTPARLRQEAAKLGDVDALIAVHIKQRYRAETVAELHALELPHLVIGRSGAVYTF